MNRLQLAFKALTTRSSNMHNIFGTIAGGTVFPATRMDFIPSDNQGNIIELKGTNVDPQWLGLSSKTMQFWAYNYCSPLAAVIDRLAEADTNGIVEFVNEDGTTYKNPNKNPRLKRIKDLFAKPNPFQTFEEYNSQQIVIGKIFGYSPVWSVCPAGMDRSFTKALINLNPYFWTPIPNEKFDPFDSDSNPIKEWTGNIFGHTYTIPADDVMLIKDGYIDSHVGMMGLPISKIAGLDFHISNICAAMEADNVLLKKKGPLGVFSFDPKPDMAGWTPMGKEEQKEIQDDLSKYGLTLGTLQYIVSKTPVKWNAMSFNLRDLMTKETIRSGTDGICDRLGYPAELMSGKNATYENRSSAERFLYQNNIIPFSLRRMARYNKFFQLEEVKLAMDYDHLPVLQEDTLKAGEAFKAEADGIDVLWKAGLLTFNQVLKRLDLDTVAGMDIYYPEWAKVNGIDLNPKKEKKNDTSSKDTGAKK